MFGSLFNKIRFVRNPIAFCRNLGVTIGENCAILGTRQPFGSEPYLVTIGDHVRINDGVQFITHDGGVWVLRTMSELSSSSEESLSDIDLFGEIVIGDNVQIGSNVMILPGVKIGSNVVIGAGAIVTKSIPNNSVAVGIPARVIESIEDYYNKNKNRFVHTKNMSSDSKKKYLMEQFNKDNQ